MGKYKNCRYNIKLNLAIISITAIRKVKRINTLINYKLTNTVKNKLE